MKQLRRSQSQLFNKLRAATDDQVKLYNFKFVAYTDIYRVWSGRYLLFPKSEPDLTLLTRLQDVVCLLPHASQWNLLDTVVPAIDKSQNNNRAELELHGLHGCMFKNE